MDALMHTDCPVPVNRDTALKEAEQLLRQGKLDSAIDAYVRLVNDRPSDWSSINTLGDLCLRAGDVERAIAQFTRVADQFFSDGSLQKAAALYKKALRAQDDHEPALQQLGEIAVRQGLQADAEVYLQRLAEQRRRRGDDQGAEESLARLHALKKSQTQSRDAVAMQADAGVGGHLSAAPSGARGENEAAGGTATSDTSADHVARSPVSPQVADAGESPARFAPEALPESASPGGLQRIEDDAPADDALAVQTEAPMQLDVPVEVDVPLETEALITGEGPPEVEVPVKSEGPLETDALLEVELGDALDEVPMAPDDAVDAPVGTPLPEPEQAAENGARDSTAVDVAALESATHDAGTRFAAATALGRHYVRQGEVRTGIQWLDRAVEAAPPWQGVAFSVLSDLADALESLGETSRALAVLIDFDLDSGGYRDARARIDRLMRAQTRSDG
jgi:tetratricopeptide (TPR) repeat protein